MSSYVDEALLIRSIKARECLWNNASKDFKNRERKHAEWNAVAREVGSSRDVCEKKWKSLKSVFSENIRKLYQSINAPPGTPPVDIKWIHFTEMMFLKDLVLNRHIETRTAQANDQSSLDTLMQSEDGGSEMSFLKSIAPSLRQIPDYFKEDAKIEILQVIAKYKKMRVDASEFIVQQQLPETFLNATATSSVPNGSFHDDLMNLLQTNKKVKYEHEML